MSSKSVKITNGKILNYKISASGYKTIYGSQVISSDTTINKNMIAESDPNGVYSFGDRIGNIATFVDYFNTTNPETNVDTKYAVFVLDAAYRLYNIIYARAGSGTQIPSPLGGYDTYTNALNSNVSATDNCDYFLATDSTYKPYSAINTVREISITLGGSTYYAQVPNLKEMNTIKTYNAQLDALDPSTTGYKFSNIGSSPIHSSTLYANSNGGVPIGFWFVTITGSNSMAAFNSANVFTVPIFEIPVN